MKNTVNKRNMPKKEQNKLIFDRLQTVNERLEKSLNVPSPTPGESERAQPYSW